MAQQFPFEVRYHTATKKITIEGHQLLGTWTKDGVDLQVIFESFIALNGGIHLSGYTGSVYRGSLNGDRLYMFPEYLVLDGRTYEFRTMAYAGFDSGEDFYYSVTGDVFHGDACCAVSVRQPGDLRCEGQHDDHDLDSLASRAVRSCRGSSRARYGCPEAGGFHAPLVS